MLVCFGLAQPCGAADLWERYQAYYRALSALDVAAPLKDAWLQTLNDAYDAAIAETSDAEEAATSPRRA